MSEIVVIITVIIRLIQLIIDLKITFVQLNNKIRTIIVLMIVTMKIFRKMITVTTIINHSNDKRNISLLINSTIFHIKIELIKIS